MTPLDQSPLPTRVIWTAQYEAEFPARGGISGHLWTLIRSIGHLRLKVWQCPMPKILQVGNG